MTGFIVSVFLFRNRVSPKEAFEGLELGEGKPSRPVLRGPGGRKVAWPLGSNANVADGGIRKGTRSDESGPNEVLFQHDNLHSEIRNRSNHAPDCDSLCARDKIGLTSG